MKNIDNFLNLQGKVAIVTGAATGLCAATAQMLSASGANVLINHMPGQESQAQTVANDCVTESYCHAGDITQDEDCKRTVQSAINRWGHVDILVNNAGINKFVEHYDLDGLNAKDFVDIYSVNVIGAFQMIRAVTPTMKAQGSGVVVNISSAAGEIGGGSCVAYAASKGAINTMTKSLGRALAPEIRVNAVCPAFINTPIWEKRLVEMSQAQRTAWLENEKISTPLQLENTPELIVRSILFLASDLSAHLTGQLLSSDGGMLLGAYQSMFEQSD
jgi:3-oxoacyl-[acyl-carrier protein] reductase